jgi:hypothetical protein
MVPSQLKRDPNRTMLFLALMPGRSLPEIDARAMIALTKIKWY